MDDGYLMDFESFLVKRLIFIVDGMSRILYFVFGSFECFGLMMLRFIVFFVIIYNVIFLKLNEFYVKFLIIIIFIVINYRDFIGKVGSIDIFLLLIRYDMFSIEFYDIIVVIEILRKYIIICESFN